MNDPTAYWSLRGLRSEPAPDVPFITLRGRNAREPHFLPRRGGLIILAIRLLGARALSVHFRNAGLTAMANAPCAATPALRLRPQTPSPSGLDVHSQSDAAARPAAVALVARSAAFTRLASRAAHLRPPRPIVLRPVPPSDSRTEAGCEPPHPRAAPNLSQETIWQSR